MCDALDDYVGGVFRTWRRCRNVVKDVLFIRQVYFLLPNATLPWIQMFEFEVIHVGSAYQHADFLTKALSREAFEFHRDIVMNVV